MKRSVLGLLLLSVFTMNSCVAWSAAAEPTPTPIPMPANPMPTSIPMPANYSDLSISMLRGPGDGMGPIYSLEIHADGNVSYEGMKWVAIVGKRNAKITPKQIEELVAAIEKANVWALKDEYRSWLGFPSIFLSITLNGRTKLISHSGRLDCEEMDGGAPMALCDLEHKIEAAVNSDQWVKPTSKP